VSRVPDNAAATGEAVRRLNVVFLARDLVMGGAERAWLDYVNHCERFQPVGVLGRRDGVLLRDLRDDVPLFDLAHPVPRDAGGITGADRTVVGDEAPGGFTPRSLARLATECHRLNRVLRLTGARVVSSFLMRSHLIALLTRRWLRPDLRVVVNVHEHMTESAVHLYPTALDRRMMRWITRNLFPQADAIVVVADALRQDLEHNFAIPSALIRVVHNPIDLCGIRNRAAEAVTELALPDDGSPVVIAVGRLVRLKGFDILIRAFARLPAELRAKLVIVGGGPDRAALEALVAQLGLHESVVFAGVQRNPWKFMARAHAFVLSSLTEAFPSVIGEALALGLPVLAADCSAGVREYLQGTRHGLLVPPGDVAALAGALEQLLRDDALRTTLAARGPARMAELDLPIVVRRYEDLLAEVLPAAGASRTRSRVSRQTAGR
jgi:glycosyltransferase involved in cell wall biosynthesis